MEDQPLQWWQVRWGLAGRVIARFAVVSGKIIGVLGLVAATVLVPIYLIEPWLTARQLGKFPRLNMTPETLSTQDIARSPAVHFDCYGFSLLLPREEVRNPVGGDCQLGVPLRSGGWLRVTDTSRDSMFFTLAKNDPRSKKLLGQSLLQSTYSLEQAAMSATPQQIKWWGFRFSGNERVEYLLGLRLVALLEPVSLHPGEAPVYTIAFGEFRGFQIGSPSIAPYNVHLDLFDQANRYFACDTGAPEGHGPLLTQEEINSIVASIQPASAP